MPIKVLVQPTHCNAFLSMKVFQSVCQVAEVLVRLQQAGNVSYIGWSLLFNCSRDATNELQERAKIMEQELFTWQKEVDAAREKYYELNYYTTTQLLFLREELGKMNNLVSASQFPPNVLPLLQSISHQVTKSKVHQAVLSACTCHSESSTNCEPELNGKFVSAEQQHVTQKLSNGTYDGKCHNTSFTDDLKRFLSSVITASVYYNEGLCK